MIRLKDFQTSVTVKLTGKELERFLSLCQRQGIELKNLSKEPSGIFCDMKISDFFISKKYMKKSRTHCHVVQKKGLYYICRAYQKGIELFLQFVAFVILVLWLSGRLWVIRIEGVEGTIKKRIEACLSEEQIWPGIPLHRIRSLELVEGFREHIDELTWVSVSVKGYSLVIKCKTNDCMREQKKEESNVGKKYIICPVDGVVKSIFLRQGVAMVKKEDQVFRGEILVSGSIPISVDGGNPEEMENELRTIPDADICMEYHKTYTCQRNYEDSIVGETGKSVIYPFVQWNEWKLRFQFPFTDWKYIKLESTHKKIKIWQNKKPFFVKVGYEKVFEMAYFPVRYSEDDLREILLAEMFQKLAILEEKGVQIIEKNVTIESNYEGMTCICDLVLQEEITHTSVAYGAISDGF